MHINVAQLGLLDYATALRLQQTLVELRKRGDVADTLLLLEHTPVITLGRNGKRQNIVATDERLAAEGVEVFECDRGGDVTYHGPGQLVGYPIFDLRAFEPKLGAVDFVRRIEESLIRVCADFDIGAKRIAGRTGVWTEGGAKIAAIGVHISRGVTSHGLALNVATNLRHFELIVPCGIEACQVTSIEKELGRAVEMQDVAHSVTRQFGQAFRRQIVWVEDLDALVGRNADIPARPPAELRKLREEDTHWA